eukprot:CFRG1264T1
MLCALRNQRCRLSVSCLVRNQIDSVKYCIRSPKTRVHQQERISTLGNQSPVQHVCRHYYNTRTAGVPLQQSVNKGLVFSCIAVGTTVLALQWYTKRNGLSWKAKECILRSDMYEAAGDVVNAKRKLIEAAALTEKEYGHQSLNMVYILDKVADFCHRHGYLELAEVNYKRLVQAMLKLGYPESNRGIVGASLSLADIYMENDNMELALAGYEWCLVHAQQRITASPDILPYDESYTSNFFPRTNGEQGSNKAKVDEEFLVICLERLGGCLYARGPTELKRACETLTKAVEYREEHIKGSKIGDPDHDNYVIRLSVLYNDLATVQHSLGNFQDSEDHVLKALKLLEGIQKTSSVEDVQLALHRNLEAIQSGVNSVAFDAGQENI